MISRRGLVSLALLSAGAITTLAIVNYKKEEKIGKWVKTGNVETMEAYTHYVWEIKTLDNGISDIHELNGSVEIPDGYALIDSEPILSSRGQNTFTKGVKYNFINTVDVQADEYINEETNETGFPLFGTPVDLELAMEKPKIYSKMN